MSKNSKRIRIKILNPVSGCGHTCLAHARRYVKRGVAEWVGDSIRFLERAPRRDEVLASMLASFRPTDSGQSGFLRYPQPQMTTTGSKYLFTAR